MFGHRKPASAGFRVFAIEKVGSIVVRAIPSLHDAKAQEMAYPRSFIDVPAAVLLA